MDRLVWKLKTTIPSTFLDIIKQNKASVEVALNGVQKRVFFADTFAQVPCGQLFLYNGSTAAIGPNPNRSERYDELSANGVFSQFGVDFFENNDIKPKSGDIIDLNLTYPN